MKGSTEKARLWGESLSQVLQLLLLEFGNEALHGFSKAADKTPGLTPDVWIAAAHRGFNKDRCKNVHQYKKAEELLDDKHISHLVTRLFNHTLKDIDDTMASYILELNAEFETKEPFVEHPTPDSECNCTRKSMLKLMLTSQERPNSSVRDRCKNWCSTHPEWAYAMMAIDQEWRDEEENESNTLDESNPEGDAPDKSTTIMTRPTGKTLEESVMITAAKLRSKFTQAHPDYSTLPEEEEKGPSVPDPEDKLEEDFRQGGWGRDPDR